MKIGSLFAGIGGLELGLERAGVGETVWQVERDEFCRQVLARHWPDAVRYEDVTTTDWSEVERVDVICGGFPCQDISLAGRGAGLAGERSGLWRELHRAVRELRPRFVVVENVAALLVRGLGDVLGDLAAGGYDAEWDCIPAAAVGAPHLRDRVFVVAYTDSERHRRLQPVSEPGSGDQAGAQDDGAHGHVGYPERLDRSTTGSRNGRPRALERPAGSDGGQWGNWSVEPDVGRVVDGLPSDVDLARHRALGNAVVPQVAEVVGRRLLQIDAELR